MIMRHSNSSLVFDLREADTAGISAAGGKGANLAQLFRIEGIQVPEGFCIATAAFQHSIENTPQIAGLLSQLSGLKQEDSARISELCSALRQAIAQIPVAADIEEAIDSQLQRFGGATAFAIRSSATAEDLPTASFAGQQDTYLNIRGKASILAHIAKCWASLFTERAVMYRIQNGFDHRKVHLAVVVQQMIFPLASGILFTADPVTGHRKVTSIDAGFGLGEALVSGRVNPDIYKVQGGVIRDKKIAVKKLAVLASDEGGTQEHTVTPELQSRPVLTDTQVLELEQKGRKIEAYFGCPQDIEWCLDGDTFYIVQSRPITTLFPIPEADDGQYHVYISVGHQQMMTDPLKPLGLSIRQLSAMIPMCIAGGRQFVDVTQKLASAEGRNILINVLGKSDPLIRDALQTIIARSDLASAQSGKEAPMRNYEALSDYDPAVVTELIGNSQAAVAALKRDIQAKTGTELIDFIFEAIEALKKILADPRSFGVIVTAMNAAFWLNDHMKEWLGEEGNVADTLSLSVPDNVTSEMGLALLDVADVIRPYPEVVAWLEQAGDDMDLDMLLPLAGGQEARNAIAAYLDRYGMRCAGEIDITRTRWNEKPATLLPLLLSNIRNFAPGAGKEKFEQGLRKALHKEEELLGRLAALPGGEQKVQETKRMIGLVRRLTGYREYPKYDIVSHYFIYKQALLKEAAQLVSAQVIRDPEDIYYLTLEELRETIRDQKADYDIIGRRKEEYRGFEKLSPPRVLTSDGEAVTGAYKREQLPDGALPGLAVSAGTIEGRARVIFDMEEADIEEGDILVTPFTDPSWTPLFVAIKGLVTEVGGLMTHGAVIAREYGLPAVVGVEQATHLIKDGQRIRVNGTEGYVELL